jgi:hypothetical protein
MHPILSSHIERTAMLSAGNSQIALLGNTLLRIAVRRNLASLAARLMMALEEDCLEPGLDPSIEQLQRIERAVRGITDPRGGTSSRLHGLPLIDSLTAIPARGSS